MPTDENILQWCLDLSVPESRVYALKLQGWSLKEISDYLGMPMQSVKNLMTKVNAKRRLIVNIVTIYQEQEGQTRRAIADMALRILATDLASNPDDASQLCKGKHTEILFNAKVEPGDTDFVVKNVFTKIDPLVHNEVEAERKARDIYITYLREGGAKGQMGYGWICWLFNKFKVKYEIY